MIKVEFTKITIKRIELILKIYIKSGHTRAVRKIMAILMFAKRMPIEQIADMWQVSQQIIYNWVREFLSKGLQSFCGIKRKGSTARLTDEQRKQLKQIIIDGPEQVGFDRATWNSGMIAEVIAKKYKVHYNPRYICAILKDMGLSYLKAKWISDKDNSEQITLWKNETWKNLLRRAIIEKAAILFVDEASFALWGSLGYTWGISGQQPLIKTSGKRKNIKVFGAIDYFSGKFIFQSEEHKLNTNSYLSFLGKLLKRFSGKIFLIHDGAPYHRSKEVTKFFSENSRIEATRLPAYCPEFNLIEYLWRKAKGFTHNKYFADFAQLKKYVHSKLRGLQKQSSGILNLCNSYEKILDHDFRNVA